MADDHRHSRSRHDLCMACNHEPQRGWYAPITWECRNKGHTAYVHTEIHKPEMRIAAHRMNRNVRDGCFHDAGFHNPGHTEAIQSLAGIHASDALDKLVPDSTDSIILILEELAKQAPDTVRNEPDNDNKAEQPASAYSELCDERFPLLHRLPLAPLAY